MAKPFVVDHVNTSLEGFLDKSMSKSELQIRWVVESICKKHPWCFYSNRELAEQFNLHPMTVSSAVRSLIKKGAIISEIENTNVGPRRRMKLNPEYVKKKNHLVVEYNGKIVKRRVQAPEQEGGAEAKALIPISQSTYTPQGKSNNSRELAGESYNNVIYNDSYFLSENKYQACGLVTKQAKPPIEQEGTKMPVSTRAVGRVLVHWNSKGAPLTRHKAGGTKQFKNITAALQEALLGATEKEILDAIDLYHRSLTDPTLTLYKFRGLPPTKVSLDEFFKFRPESVNMINVYKISQLQGVKSWFELLRKGEKAIRDRFGIVPEDKHPIVTSMLKKTITSLDRSRSVSGNESERILRQASVKLVEFHQRVKPRIIGWKKVEVFSAPEFLQTRLYDFMRESLNLDRFELYWMIGNRFYRDFERYLERTGAIAREEEPQPRHRYGKPTERDLMACRINLEPSSTVEDDPTIPDHVKRRSR